MVIAVQDVNAAVKPVQENGGRIIGAMVTGGQPGMEPQMIPGVGMWISIEDTRKKTG